MSEMMGYGGMGFGGSSSSTSNLSPLAPPFTVDRWNPKPSSTPPLHVTEPSFAVPIYSSFNNWEYPPPSSSSRPDLYPNSGSEIDSIRTTPLPWAQDYDYQYFGSVADTSPSVPPVNPHVSSDTFTYLKYPNDIQNHSVDAKPYHPQAAPALDDHIPAAAYSEHPYDLLPTSRVDPSNVPSRVDYTQILTGLDYAQPWGSFWNGFSEEDQPKGNCGKEGIKIAGSYGNINYTAQGFCTSESLSGREEAGISFGRRENQILSPVEDERYSAEDPRFPANVSSKAYTSGISSTIPKSHAVVTHLQTDTNAWSHQKPYGPVYDSFFPSFDSSMDEHITVKKASPAVIIRPPSTGTASTMQNELSETVTAKNISDHNSMSKKPVQKDVLDHMSMAGKEFQLFEKNVPDGFTVALDVPKGFISVKDSSECVDHYNPSVDSPCWKGAPASRFFPSDASEAATAPQVTKQLEISDSLKIHQTYPSSTDNNSLNLHQTCFPHAHNDSLNAQQIQTLQRSTDDSPKASHQSIFENTNYLGNGYAELGSILYLNKAPDFGCATRVDASAKVVNDVSNCPQPSKSAAAQTYSGSEKGTNECNLLNRFTRDSDMKSYVIKMLGPGEDDLISGRGSEKYEGAADRGLHVNVTLNEPSLFSLGTESTPLLPDSTKEGSKLAACATEFPSKVNAQMLVNTMHNLSEFLLFHYSTGACDVTEQDQETLKRVLNNTSACLSKTALNVMPMQESLMSCEGVLRECREASAPHKGDSAGRLMDFSNGSHDLSDRNSLNEGSRKHGLFGKDAERFPCFDPLGGDANIAKDDSLVRALKDVLQENFDGEEEMRPETLLFKNLWLEAEAALCSVNFRTRYNHVKSELEKGRSKKTQDLVENTKTCCEEPSSKVSCNATATYKAAAEPKDGSGSDGSTQKSLNPSPVEEIDDDIDPSVLARLRILKSRGQDSNFVNHGGEQLTDVLETGFMDNENPQLHCGDEKCTSLQTKDVIESTKMVDEGPNINVSSSTMEAVDKGNSILEDPVQRKVIDDVDASVLARLRILRCRAEGSDSVYTEEKQHVQGGLDTGFMDNGGARAQYNSGNVDSFGSFARDFDRERVKEFGVSATKETVNSYGDGRSGGQLSSGWGGSSDWEHVLKDEFAHQKW